MSADSCKACSMFFFLDFRFLVPPGVMGGESSSSDSSSSEDSGRASMADMEEEVFLLSFSNLVRLMRPVDLRFKTPGEGLGGDMSCLASSALGGGGTMSPLMLSQSSLSSSKLSSMELAVDSRSKMASIDAKIPTEEALLLPSGDLSFLREDREDRRDMRLASTHTLNLLL